MYWDNVEPSLVQGQANVFKALGVPLQQHRAHRVPHGAWMDQVVQKQPEDAVIVFCDIDAFPLSRAAFDRAVSVARADGVFGLAQFSNHKPTTDLYAGPMFMAFRKALWTRLGCPSLLRNKTCDAGEALTLTANAHGVWVDLVKPTGCLKPKWALKNEGLFGVGTFYGANEFFHLFESRHPAHEALFALVAEDVVQGRPLQFDAYLDLMNAAPVATRSSWWSRLFGRY